MCELCSHGSRVVYGLSAEEVLLQQRELEKEPTRTCELKPLAAVVSLSASQCLLSSQSPRVSEKRSPARTSPSDVSSSTPERAGGPDSTRGNRESQGGWHPLLCTLPATAGLISEP